MWVCVRVSVRVSVHVSVHVSVQGVDNKFSSFIPPFKFDALCINFSEIFLFAPQDAHNVFTNHSTRPSVKAADSL